MPDFFSHTHFFQTVSNACASVAMLNIVNNIPNIDLGLPLQNFKEFTADFPPALRGDAIGKFDFVRVIHNSLARYVKASACFYRFRATSPRNLHMP